MNPPELEFLAEKELVEIVPKFTLDAMFLMDGKLGPFSAGLPARVPLWVALDLRRRERCTLVAPHWMNTHTLEMLKKEERENAFFTKMPNEHYMAMATVIFRSCSQDVPDADKVKNLIKDIWDNRISKLRTAVLTFIETEASFAKVDNLTQMEMATVRPFFPHALEQIHRIRMSARAAASTADSTSRSQSFLNSSHSQNTHNTSTSSTSGRS